MRIVQSEMEPDHAHLGEEQCEECSTGCECPDDPAERLCTNGRQRTREGEEVVFLNGLAREQYNELA